MQSITNSHFTPPTWNKGKLLGQKAPLKLQEIWAIRIRLQLSQNIKQLALFNLALDSKLRCCDLLKLRVLDVTTAGIVSDRAMVMQQKTHHPVQFEITTQTRKSLETLITQSNLKYADYLFKSRVHASAHLSTRQYARIVKSWVSMIGLDPSQYGTHTMGRTKATLIYRRTKNIRAVQIRLGHT